VKLKLVPILLFALVLASCGGGGSSGGEVDAGKSADQLLSEAAQKSSELSSFHFRFTHEKGTTPLPLGLQLESAEGDVAVPGRLSADVKAKRSGIGVNVKVVGIDDRTWITNPFTRGWERLSGTSLRDFADPAALVTSLLPLVREARYEDQPEVGGVKTHRIRGTIDSEALQPALGFAEPGLPVQVEAWIGVEDGLPRRVKLTGPLETGENKDVVRQVDLSDFNKPVNIQPPG
jgi:hypothetical protein